MRKASAVALLDLVEKYLVAKRDQLPKNLAAHLPIVPLTPINLGAKIASKC